MRSPSQLQQSGPVLAGKPVGLPRAPSRTPLVSGQRHFERLLRNTPAGARQACGQQLSVSQNSLRPASGGRRHSRGPQGVRGLAAAAAGAEAQTAPPIYKEQLRDPAHIGCTTVSELELQDRDGAICLNNYMTLPIEQYDELDPAMIRSLGGNRYTLQVPRTALFNVWVEPIVEVEVNLQLTPARRAVVIKATNWGLRGSELIENLNLSRRFSLEFTAELTWSTSAEAAAARRSPQGAGQVHGNIKLDVFSEVLGPFQLIPRAVLEAGGDAVMGALAGQLLPIFLRRLAADYGRWAADPAYRLRRAQKRAN